MRWRAVAGNRPAAPGNRRADTARLIYLAVMTTLAVSAAALAYLFIVGHSGAGTGDPSPALHDLHPGGPERTGVGAGARLGTRAGGRSEGDMAADRSLSVAVPMRRCSLASSHDSCAPGISAAPLRRPPRTT